MLLEDQVVVITGAGPGLGSTLARRCAEEGADVVVAARTKATLDAIAKEVEACGRRGLAVPTDVVVHSGGECAHRCARECGIPRLAPEERHRHG